MLQRAVFIVYLLLCSAQLFGQEQVIEGFLVDKSTKKALNHIHVLLKSSDHKLLTFKETKADGAFSLATVKDVDGAYLEINHLGYHKKIIPWTEVGLKKTIELEQKVVLLEDVEVKSRPQIRQIGDTLAYNVASFAKRGGP